MTTFADDFERADGPIGNGWSTYGSANTIESGKARSSNRGVAYRHPFGTPTLVRARANVKVRNNTGSCSMPMVKVNSTGANGYAVYTSGGGANLIVFLGRYAGWTFTTLGSTTIPVAAGDWATLELVYDDGELRAYVNDVLALTRSDSTYAAEYGVGVRHQSIYGRCEWFDCDDTPAQAFDAEPEPLVEMAIPEEVTFTGTDTAWEPGTPGQPIFEVDKGTLDSQTVTSATTASAMYTPPQATDTATFTDPSTGLTDQIALSTGFQVDGGEGLPEDIVAYLQRSADAALPDLAAILNDNSTAFSWETELTLPSLFGDLHAMMRTTAGPPPGSPPTRSLLDTLWWILNGHGDVDEDHNVLDYSNTAAVESTNAVLALSAIRTDELYTIQTILDAIEATIPPDLSGILAELAAIRTGELLTLADPISAVEAARGSGLPTVRDVLDELETIRSPLALTLADLRALMISLASTTITAINNVSSQVTGVMNRLINTVEPAIRAIRGADNVDLTQLHDQAGQLSLDMVNHFGHVDTAIAGVRGLDARDLTEVYDAIADLPQEQVSLQPVLNAISALSASVTQSRDAILAAIAAIRPADYPLWPGAGAAELGVPVSGSGDLSIPGPLDGLLVDVTSYPTEIRAWTVAGRVGLKWAGHVTFVSDIGYTEEIQFPGTDKRVLVPKSMLTCASALVHLRPGVQATVTPWYYAP